MRPTVVLVLVGTGDESDKFTLTDTLPSLPRLEASARNGCEFCGLLRTTIFLQASDEKTDPVESTRSFLNQESHCTLGMYWMWFREGVEKYGLPLGLLSLKIDIRVPENDDCVTVTFGAEAIDKGWSTPILLEWRGMLTESLNRRWP